MYVFFTLLQLMEFVMTTNQGQQYQKVHRGGREEGGAPLSVAAAFSSDGVGGRFGIDVEISNLFFLLTIPHKLAALLFRLLAKYFLRKIVPPSFITEFPRRRPTAASRLRSLGCQSLPCQASEIIRHHHERCLTSFALFHS